MCAGACTHPATSGTWQPRTPSQTSHGFAQVQPGCVVVDVDVVVVVLVELVVGWVIDVVANCVVLLLGKVNVVVEVDGPVVVGPPVVVGWVIDVVVECDVVLLLGKVKTVVVDVDAPVVVVVLVVGGGEPSP